MQGMLCCFHAGLVGFAKTGVVFNALFVVVKESIKSRGLGIQPKLEIDKWVIGLGPEKRGGLFRKYDYDLL